MRRTRPRPFSWLSSLACCALVLLPASAARAQLCTNLFSGGDALCESDEKCRQGTCVPECSDDFDCPRHLELFDTNGQLLQLCDETDACIFNRSSAVGTSLCLGDAPGAWEPHFIDGAVACDSAPLLAPELERARGGDNGADGVDVCDVDRDGDLDIVTGWEEGGEVFLYLNPLRGELPGGQQAGPELLRVPWPVVDARGRGTNDGENQRKQANGIEDAVFADLLNPGITTGRGLCDPGASPNTFITAQEGTSRKVVMRTPDLLSVDFSTGEVFFDPDAIRNEAGWEAREFGDTEKFFMQAAAGDIDGKNCNDVVVGAKDNDAGDFDIPNQDLPGPEDIPNTIEGGVWYFACPGRVNPFTGERVDVSAETFQDITSFATFQELLRQDSGALNANGPWNRHKIGDGKFFMNVVLDDVDGDGDNDVVFSDRKRVGWFKNPLETRDPADGAWERIVVESNEDIEAWCIENTVLSSGGNQIGPACLPDAVPDEVFRDMAYADLDGDGLEDIVATTNYWIEEANVVARWYRRLPGPGVAWQAYEISADSLPFGKEAGEDGPPISKSVFVGDIDGDGDNDLVLTVRGGGHGVYSLSFPDASDDECGGPCINADARERNAWSAQPIAPSYPVMKYDNVVLADLDEDCDLDAVTAEEFVVDHGVGLGVPWYENPAVSQRPVALCRDVLRNAAPGSCAVEIAAADVSDGSSVDTGPIAQGVLLVGLGGGPAEESVSVPVGTDVPVQLTAMHQCQVARTGTASSDSCTALVTVRDVEAPDLACPAGQVVECRAGTGVLDFALPEAIDNCDANVATSCSPAPGTALAVGTSDTASCTASDASGQSASCSFGYEVVDSLAPTFPAATTNALGFLVLPRVTETCTGPLTEVEVGTPAVNDLCDGPLTPEAVFGLEASYPVGVSVLGWSATDARGHATEAGQVVEIVDEGDPTVTAPADVSGVECASPLGTPVSLGSPTTEDLCDGSPSVGSDAPALFPKGVTAVEWTASDAAGNSDSDTQNVEVVDTTAPSFAGVLLGFPILDCTGVLTPVAFRAPQAQDQCQGAIAATAVGGLPTEFPLGTSSFTWRATDAEGLFAEIEQSLIVRDGQPPAITPPADVVGFECTGSAGTLVPLGSPVSVSDLCDPARVSVANDAPASFALGTHPVSWTATDGSNNQASAVQTVEVVDTTPPTITAPADVLAECAAPAGTAVELGAPGGIGDVCQPASVTFSNDAPGLFGVGGTPVVWTATDAASNVGSDVQQVTIVDTTPPVITCAESVVLEPTSPLGAAAVFETGATDTCSDALEVGCDAESGQLFPAGATTPAACSAEDPAGNRADCGFSVRVLSCGELATSLEQRAQGLGLNSGETLSLVTRLRNVRRAITEGNRPAACGEIGGIRNSVAAWIGAGQLAGAVGAPYLASLDRLAACTPCGE
jgi:hypothetical protein